jgi:hypothetical protein
MKSSGDTSFTPDVANEMAGLLLLASLTLLPLRRCGALG